MLFNNIYNQLSPNGKLLYDEGYFITNIEEIKTIDYFKNMTYELENLTLEQVQNSAKTHINSECITIVVAGDREIIEEPLSKLGHPISIVNSSDATR